MRTHHHDKNCTHKRRRYRGGVSPKVKSKLRNVVSASAAASLEEEESTTDSPLNPKKFTRKLPTVRKLVLTGVGSTRKLPNPIIAKYVKAARNTRSEVEEAKDRSAKSKLPSTKRSPGKSAQTLIDMKETARKRKESEAIKEAERKKAAALNKANAEKAVPPPIQRRGTFVPMNMSFNEEEEEELRPPVKPLTPKQKREMNAAVKKTLQALEEEE